eukprot:4481432-Heterocapsa_arctica.AAC.1
MCIRDRSCSGSGVCSTRCTADSRSASDASDRSQPVNKSAASTQPHLERLVLEPFRTVDLGQ